MVLLGQVGEDVGVEHSSLQEAAPLSSQLGAELAHIPADLLRNLLVPFLQLNEIREQSDTSFFMFTQNALDLILHYSIKGSLVFLPT